jgi:hypothetical protein
MSLAPETIRWFKDRRGIDQTTLEAFGIDSEDAGVTIPYPDGAVKHRATLEKVDGKHRMWFDPKAAYGQPPFLAPDFSTDGKSKIVFEGESDTMAAWQAAPSDIKPHIMGISGATAFGPRGIPDEKVEELFGEAERVFFVLDNEDPYENPEGAASVERGKQHIKDKFGRRAKFVRLPLGPQDACEFFMVYDWAAFHELMLQSLEVKRHYKRFDLDKPPPPTDWLVEGMFPAGEVVVLSADGGTGKSWFTMALALAVAGDEDEFLGLPVVKHGPVIYVDEENPGDLVSQRMHALGYETAKHSDNLEYLVYQNVDLARQKELLLEEAEGILPKLIVIESLSRVSLGVEENSNTEMTNLFRAALVPLARNSGACVVATHHTIKDGSTSRGASAIRNAADEMLAMRIPQTKAGNDRDYVNIFPDKPRRQLDRASFRIEGDMEKGEPVRLVALDRETPF